MLYKRSSAGGNDIIEIGLNDQLDKSPFSGSSEIELELDPDALVIINGEEIHAEALIGSDNSIQLDYGKIIVTYDPEKKTASSISIDEQNTPQIFAAKVDIEIEVSYPPFKIKIVIRC